MKHPTLNIPDHLDERETKRFFAAKRYETGKLSLGQASELAGLLKLTIDQTQTA
ncbi:UPF0175 family protein [Negadavirga shengliensis]|uniref:UPF0175 family protein n=1 Tax=Negadavirga shengliensis TaxID=1389218 RepID=A0ABV9T6C9_9BACT